MGRVLGCDEKLGTIRPRPGISHGQFPGLCVLDQEVFVGEFFSVNRFTTGPVSASEVASLDHKILDDAVESASLVVQWLAQRPLSLFTRTQGPEILGRLGRNICVELHDNLAQILFSVPNVKVNVWIVALGVRNYRSGNSLLFAVKAPLDATKHAAKNCLFLVLGLLGFLLELLNGFSDLLVAIVDFVSVHEIDLGLLVHSKVHASKSLTVESLDVGFGFRIDFQNLVAGSDGVRPRL
mmetsp:Transcript_606/g.1411  ORF Transcript_606/g.1411 Transcript_606/m.1411 type:complete len:238 (+) Transcript_606:296-1009(+)